MRKLLGAVLVALLMPTAVAAQKPVTPGETRMAPKKGPPWIPSDVAANTALTRVRTDLAAGKLSAWGDPHVSPAASVSAADTRALKKGGRDGGPIYLVFVTAPKGKGQVRVAVNAETGAIINVIQKDWAGQISPDWWLNRAEADPDPGNPPPARRGPGGRRWQTCPTPGSGGDRAAARAATAPGLAPGAAIASGIVATQADRLYSRKDPPATPVTGGAGPSYARPATRRLRP